MANEDVARDDKAREVLETDAYIARANTVRNAMAAAVSNLQRDDVSAELKGRARADIDSAWSAVSHRDASAENRLRLMVEVDKVAASTAEATASGQAVLDRLPPELAKPLVPHAAALGQVVEAWRNRKPGRGAGGKPGKWAALVAVWKLATGEATKGSLWEAAWKEARSKREKVHSEAIARAAAENARAAAENAQRPSP
jgi:hypothetical protein